MRKRRARPKRSPPGPRPPGPARKPKPDIEITVSDHAVVRFLERVMGLDVGAIRKIIASESVHQQAAVLGGEGNHPVAIDNLPPFWVMLRHFHVVTITLEKIKSFFPIHDHEKATDVASGSVPDDG